MPKTLRSLLRIVALLALCVWTTAAHADALTAASTANNPTGDSAPLVSVVPTFTKSFTPATIGPGSTTTLQFDIENLDPVTVSDMAFTDVLPTGVTIATPASATSTCGGTLSAPDGGTTISLTDGTLGASASCTITVNVIGSTTGTHTNTSGDLTSSLGNSGPATADLVVDEDLPGFSKSFSPAIVPPGGTSTLTFLIDNSSNPSDLSSLIFDDTLPPGMVIATPSNAFTDCRNSTFPAATTLTATSGTSTIELDAFGSAGFPILEMFETCIVTVDVTVSGTGLFDNVSDELFSSLSASPTLVSSGFATDHLDAAVRVLTKRFTTDPVAPGGTVDLLFTITNLSRTEAATSIAFTDDLDAALSGLMVSSDPGSLPDPAPDCGAGAMLEVLTGTSTLSFSGGSLAPEGSCSFPVVLEVPSSASAGAHTNTTSAVTYDLGGSPTVGNMASDDLLVTTAPVLTKEFTNDPVEPGGTVTLEFTITNSSATLDADDVAFTDDLTAIFPFPVSVTLPTDPCGSGSSVALTSCGTDCEQLDFSDDTLPAGGMCTFSVDIDVPETFPTGTYTNTTSDITATVDGIMVAGVPATDDLVVIGAPTLIKAFSGDPVAPGGTVTLEFTIRHSADAPTDATDIAFTDDLDATLSGLMASTPLPDPSPDCGVGAMLTGTSTLSFSGGTLAPGDECTFTVTLDVPPGASPGTYPNTTSDITATVDGATRTGPPATDDLVVSVVSFTKEFIDDPVMPGDPVTLVFTFSVDASATGPASLTFFSDDLDDALSGLMVDTGSSITNTCGGSISGTSTLIYIGPGTPISPGASCTITVPLLVPAGAVEDTYLNVTSSVSTSAGTLPPATDGLVVFEDPPPAFSKSFAPSAIEPGAVSTLTFTIDNSTSTTAATALDFTDTLPTGVVIAATPNASTTCTGGTLTAPAAGTTITYTGGTVPAMTSCTVSVDVTSSTEGSHTNVSGDLTSSLGTSGTARATLRVSSLPEVVATKVDTLLAANGIPQPGDTLKYTVVIRNDGGRAAATVVFSDFVDAGTTLVCDLPTTPTTTAGTVTTCDDSTGEVEVTVGTIAGGGSLTIMFHVVIDLPFPAFVDEVCNQGDVSGSNFTTVVTGDPDETGPGDPDDPTCTPVTAMPVLLATKADSVLDGDMIANPGDTLKYTVLVTNTGDQDAATVVFSDTLAANLTLVPGSVMTDQGTVAEGPNDFTVDLGTLPGADSTATIMFLAEIALPLPAFVDSVFNQGRVTAGNHADVLTDDPDTPAADDSTATEVIAMPVLLATKADSVLDGDMIANPGDTLKYTVLVTNTGDQDAATVVFSDTLAANLTLVPGSVMTDQGTVAEGPNDFTVDLGTLPGADSTATIMFLAEIAFPLSAGADSVFNQGRVTAGNHADVLTDDPDTPAADDSTATEVIAMPDMVLDKTDGVTTAVPGQMLTYTLSYENDGDQNATGVVLTETVPIGTTSGTNPGWEVGSVGSAFPCDGQSAGIVCVFDAGAVAVGDSLVALFAVLIDNPIGAGIEAIVDTASVADDGTNGPDPTPDDNIAIDSTGVDAMPEVTGTKRDSLVVDLDGDGQADPGDTIRYIIVVSNNGPQDAADVVLTDAPDPLTTLVVGSVTTTQGTIVEGNTAGDTTVEVDLTTVGGDPLPLLPQATATVTFDVTVNIPFPADHKEVANQGRIAFTGEAGPEETLTDDPDTALLFDPTLTPIDLSADLEVTKTVDNPTPDFGAMVTFTVTVKNLGPVEPAGARLVDLLPAGLTLVSATPSGLGNYNASTGRWETGEIGYLGSATLKLKATVNTIKPVTNTARIVWTKHPDPNPDNNGASATITPVAADLEIEKTLVGASENNSLVKAIFVLKVTNHGPSPATSVVVHDSLPAGITLLSVTASDPTDTYVPATGLWTVGSLAVGAMATLTLEVSAPATVNILNLAEIAGSDQPDQNLRNNRAGAKLGRDVPDPRRFRADVSLTKTVDNATPSPGDLIVYTLVVANGGPFTTAGVEVRDVLPSGLVFEGATTAPPPCPTCGYNDSLGVWIVDHLPAGRSATLTITARVVGSGEITNEAEVIRGNLPDPDSAPGNGALGLGEDDEARAVITVGGGGKATSILREGAGGIPEVFELGSNYPNPFNPETVIPFGVPSSSSVRIEVYNLLGRRVAVLLDGEVSAGRHEVTWQAVDLPTGVYLVRLQAGAFVKTQRVTLLK